MIDIKKIIAMLFSSEDFRNVLSWLGKKFDRAVDVLTAIHRTLAYEYGLPATEVPPHDPRRLPFVHRADQVTSQTVNVSAALGKPATRGEIMNYGEAKALITFVQKQGSATKSVEYLLPPGTTLSPSWIYDALEIREAGEGPVSVQVLAQ